MTMHACERARARYLNDRVRCKMSTVAPKFKYGLSQCVWCSASGLWALGCSCGAFSAPLSLLFSTPA